MDNQKVTPLHFEVTDYKSPYYRHIFKFESAVLGGVLLRVGDLKKKFSASQIKPIKNELYVNYVHPIHGRCNYSFPKEELKRASYHYWRTAQYPNFNLVVINFKPLSYKQSETFKNHG